jgi:hypothetical protein
MRLRHVFALLLASACGNDTATNDAMGDGGPAADAGGSQERDAAPPAPSHEVTCIDQSFSQLMLLEEPASDAIEEQDSDPGTFQNLIDATAGGMAPMESFVYARFTEDGLRQVDIDDEEAFESLEWHIALRRYVIRLNSGVSGPGDVTGARTAPMTDFEELAEVPEGLQHRTEEYFTASCDYVPDTSGIGAPATALSSFWSYPGCVAMTGNVYVVGLPYNQYVKLQVLSYYDPPENQEMCNETGMTPIPSGAGNIVIRWGFLD